MNLIERYVFRSAAGAFLLALIVLTAVVWVTQALREVDLVTSQGQTLWIFLYITALALPALIMVIAPIALFIACVYVLNRLNSDSELVVINAAGVPQWHVIKPFLLLGVLVTVLTSTISIIVMPESARAIRDMTTQIRADLLSFIIVEGRFTTVERGLTFHIRERHPDGTLGGLLIHDARASDRVLTYIADEGHIVRDGGSAFLMMTGGNINQVGNDPEKSSIITYERYVFDLSSLTQHTGSGHHHPRELRLGELRNPDPENFYYQRAPGRFRAEFHERLSAPLYPLAFVFISLAALGRPHTNRNGRGQYLMLAIGAMVCLRALGFGMANLSASHPLAVGFMYGLPLASGVAAAWLAATHRLTTGPLHLPAALVNFAAGANGLYARLPALARPRRGH